MSESPRRLVLRVGVKLMLLLAVTATGFVLLSSIDSQEPPEQHSPHPLLRLDLSHISKTNPQRLVWKGGNLILVWRNDSMVDSLQHHQDKLLDPHSLSARQPKDLPSPTRALTPELFIAFDRGTDMGCPLNWIPAGNPKAPLQPWPGGFRDNCRGSWYDAAGRVYRDQEAGRNLDIPQYRLIEGDLLEIGGNGDNAAPAN